MPTEVGLLSSQQDSFEQHEELSKLLTETDVFYVPLRNDFNEHGLNTNQDFTDLTKCFDEDLSNKHLIVTFRDIGYSLFLDSVQSIPDANDQSKIRVSGKMIVDGICIQFFGCFDYGHKTKGHSNTHAQQIIGVGRVELDEEYYRELSSTQISTESNVKEETKDDKEKAIVQPVIMRKTRQQTAKLKERIEPMTLTNKPKTRSRTISESLLAKTRTSTSTSPPPPQPPLQPTTPHSHSSISTTRSHLHSPSHMPYPLRSPRSKQHRALSPVHFPSSTTLSNSEIQSPVITNVSTTFTGQTLISPVSPTTTVSSASIESSQTHRIQIIPHPAHFSSPTTGQPSMPIQIPSTSNTGVPTASLPQLTNIFPLSQSHSLPTYIVPAANIAYVAAAPSATNPSGTPFDLTSLAGNAGYLLITSSAQHPTQPLHILTAIDHRSLPFAHYAPTNIIIPPPPIPPPSVPIRTSNILQSGPSTDSMSMIQNKRHENEEDKHHQPTFEINKQSTEQLPFKKRRYAGHQSRMATIHNDDDEVSDESVKK